MRRRPIGQILIDKGEISEVDLETALAEQERTGRRLGEILIESGRTSWLALARAIAEQVLDIQDPHDDPAPQARPEPESVPQAPSETLWRREPEPAAQPRVVPEPAAHLVPPTPFEVPEHRSEPEQPAQLVQPVPLAPAPFEAPELKLQSVEAMLRERQRAFIELVTTTETLRMKIARLEEILEERDRELTRLRVARAS
jgi:hypothetical protein